MAHGKREELFENIRQEKRRHSLISSPSKKLPIWPSVPLFCIHSTDAAVAEKNGRTQEYITAYFPALIWIPQDLDVNLETRHKTMILHQQPILPPRVQAYSSWHTEDGLCPVTDGSGK